MNKTSVSFGALLLGILIGCFSLWLGHLLEAHLVWIK